MGKYKVGDKVTIVSRQVLLGLMIRYGLTHLGERMAKYAGQTVEILGIQKGSLGIVDYYRLDTPKCDSYIWLDDMFEQFTPKFKVSKWMFRRLLKRGLNK